LIDSLEQFTEFYYKTFDENRQQLAALYVRLTRRPLYQPILEAWPSRPYHYPGLAMPDKKQELTFLP